MINNNHSQINWQELEQRFPSSSKIYFAQSNVEQERFPTYEGAQAYRANLRTLQEQFAKGTVLFPEILTITRSPDSTAASIEKISLPGESIQSTLEEEQNPDLVYNLIDQILKVNKQKNPSLTIHINDIQIARLGESQIYIIVNPRQANNLVETSPTLKEQLIDALNSNINQKDILTRIEQL
jgi:hypothetical protein